MNPRMSYLRISAKESQDPHVSHLSHGLNTTCSTTIGHDAKHQDDVVK